jgi:hypothetical protein
MWQENQPVSPVSSGASDLDAAGGQPLQATLSINLLSQHTPAAKHTRSNSGWALVTKDGQTNLSTGILFGNGGCPLPAAAPQVQDSTRRGDGWKD